MQNKNKSLLWCTQYKCRRHVSDMPLVRPWGFPWLPPGLAYTGSVAWTLWRDQLGVLVIQTFLFVFFFWKNALILLSGSESQILQCDVIPEEVGGEFLGNRRAGEVAYKEERWGEEQSSLVCCYWLWEFKTSVSEGYIAQFKENVQTDMWLGGYWLLTVVVLVMKQCVSAVWPSSENRGQWVALSVWMMSRHAGLKALGGGASPTSQENPLDTKEKSRQTEKEKKSDIQFLLWSSKYSCQRRWHWVL